MNDSRTRSAQIASTVLVIGAMMFVGAARAATNAGATDMVSAKVAQCSKLPLSKREMCIMQAESGYDSMTAPPAMSQSELAALNQTELRYADAVAACARLPLSERGTCQSRAQAERSRTMAEATKTSAGSAAFDHETANYRAAAAACNRLPLSERAMCKTNAGTSRALVEGG